MPDSVYQGHDVWCRWIHGIYGDVWSESGVERRCKGWKDSRDTSENNLHFFHNLSFVIRSFSILCQIIWWSKKSIEIEIGAVIPPQSGFVHLDYKITSIIFPANAQPQKNAPSVGCVRAAPPIRTLENPPGTAAQFVVELGRKKTIAPWSWLPGVTSWATGKVNLDILEIERKQEKRNMRYI